MKYFFQLLFLCSTSLSWAQNEITTPAGLPLKVGLLDATGNININAGSLLFNNTRYLSITGTRNMFLGEESGLANSTGASNSFVGYRSGYVNTTGNLNTFMGAYSGYANSSGLANTFLGYHSGYSNTIGANNTFIGSLSGNWNTTGSANSTFGVQTGYSLTTGNSNTFFGNSTGYGTTTGNSNSYFGIGAGLDNVSGDANVFLGARAGAHELGSNKLYIANNDTSTPLIYGDFANSKLILNGKVGAGTLNFPSSVTTVENNVSTVKNTSDFKLFVKNGILTEQLIIVSGWADYVFDNKYKLRPLSDVERYIKSNGHLPNVPSAGTVEKNGIDIGDMTRIQQEKIEELTLYVIQLDKQAAEQNKQIEMLIELLKKK